MRMKGRLRRPWHMCIIQVQIATEWRARRARILPNWFWTAPASPSEVSRSPGAEERGNGDVRSRCVSPAIGRQFVRNCVWACEPSIRCCGSERLALSRWASALLLPQPTNERTNQLLTEWADERMDEWIFSEHLLNALELNCSLLKVV